MNDGIWSVRCVLAAGLLLVACSLLPLSVASGASDLDEFKVTREPVFECANKPVVTREGDKVTIAFETKGLCDVAVAIEDADGEIIRHLASGVLGPNVPEPFQKNRKKQLIVWDGENGKGEYIDETDRVTVRVSLGLESRFEWARYWMPSKRTAATDLIVVACPRASWSTMASSTTWCGWTTTTAVTCGRSTRSLSPGLAFSMISRLGSTRPSIDCRSVPPLQRRDRA